MGIGHLHHCIFTSLFNQYKKIDRPEGDLHKCSLLTCEKKQRQYNNDGTTEHPHAKK